MSKKVLKTACALLGLLLTVPATVRGGNDDFGVWTELGATKMLPYGLSLSAEAEFRTMNLSRNVDRWSGSLGIGYKPLSFLKFGAAYTYIYGFTPGKRKEHYKGDSGLEKDWNGYNWTEHFWTPRHRFHADMTLGTKIDGVLKVSLRERYQYTHRAAQEVPRTKYRFKKDQLTPKVGYPRYDMKERAEKTTQYLRSRVKLELSRKKWRLTPYVAMELYNDLQDKWKLDKTKFATGASYKVTRRHDVSLSYLFTNDIDEDPYEGTHVLSVGYSFKF